MDDEGKTDVKKLVKKKKKTIDGEKVVKKPRGAASSPGVEEAVVKKKKKKETVVKKVVKKRKEPEKEDGLGEEEEVVEETTEKKKQKVEEEPVKRRTRSSSNLEAEEAALLAAPAGSRALTDFALTEPTRRALVKKGIKVLFPIQARTFATIFEEGKDVLARARTGTGKTLAFALPVIERLLQILGDQKPASGRAPSALVLAPTRELAQQVSSEFELCAANRLACICVYGGSPYGPQVGAMRRGVDVVVGTPGRTNDLLEKGVLDVSKLRFAVLDEADQMLDMGFKEELDKIFAAMTKAEERSRQLLLFSATLPSWVESIAKEYASNLSRIDLVNNDADGLGTIVQQASTDVKHICVPCGHWSETQGVIQDVIAAYGGGLKRTIVFCETKVECNELCDSEKLKKIDRRALHGDVPQAQREKTMAAFRKGAFRCLIATDVAARGLDMIVDLVINNKPPASRSGRADTETYVHRSGRTGRAGRKGTCVTLYTPRHRATLLEIERGTKNKFEWRAAPRVEDVLETAASEAIESLTSVDLNVFPLFEEASKKACAAFHVEGEEETPGATRALKAALAKLSGYEKKPPPRSLLTNSENFVTCLFESNGRVMNSLGYVWTALRRAIEETAIVESVKGMQLSLDETSCVFDCPFDHVEKFRLCDDLQVDVATLPTLKPPPVQKGGKGGRGKGGKGFSRGGGFGKGSKGGRGGGYSKGGGGKGKGKGSSSW